MSFVKGLGHIGIIAEDMDKSIEFYTKNLEFKVDIEDSIKTDNGVVKLTLLSAGDCVIELIEKPKDEADLRNIGPLVEHICFKVENIEKLVENLKAKGVKFETENVMTMDNLFGGIKAIFFEGPSKERIEFVEEL